MLNVYAVNNVNNYLTFLKLVCFCVFPKVPILGKCFLNIYLSWLKKTYQINVQTYYSSWSLTRTRGFKFPYPSIKIQIKHAIHCLSVLLHRTKGWYSSKHCNGAWQSYFFKGYIVVIVCWYFFFYLIWATPFNLGTIKKEDQFATPQSSCLKVHFNNGRSSPRPNIKNLDI